jgi:hypothetical protein
MKTSFAREVISVKELARCSQFNDIEQESNFTAISLSPADLNGWFGQSRNPRRRLGWAALSHLYIEYAVQPSKAAKNAF